MKKVLAAVTVSLLAASAAAQSKQLEIFSWWAGDEGPALEALVKLYKAKYPAVDVQNATVTGGSGVNARAVLKTRMLGGDPPDSFQVHAGQELTGTWVAAGRMDDLSALYKEQGWNKVFPKGLLDLISTNGKPWVVPVNVHRSNVMWYNPAKLREWGITPPKTWDQFFATCKTLQAKGITPLEVGENWTQQHLWESVALGTLGPADYLNLWNRKLKFNSPKAIKVWENFGKVLACTNTDASGLSWQQAIDKVVSGEAAFNIMGDWAAGYLSTTLKLEAGTGFGYVASPGTNGTFIMLADAFGLPKGVKNKTEVTNWLRLLGSKAGQDAFNPLKGSISPRNDSDLSKYSKYSQSAARDFRTNKIVGSLVHGAAANETFMSNFATVMEIYLSTKSATKAANAAEAIATQSNLGK
ncbi:ABC transporter substrate-binding protein [Deinococcus roseus]|uniref:Probable sugar-binding periplasmic protein n=1 Tax=Deinococcus roseus TaxID=392414 RepID=A0ABQ2CYR6_9DEIO|nr:ABC transporter substrate-binding protein [Deinococcus roseus]GGJ29383.1 sugar ABC transporter substrate-binding protein [Deinococcus roseus]